MITNIIIEKKNFVKKSSLNFIDKAKLSLAINFEDLFLNKISSRKKINLIHIKNNKPLIN